MRILLTTDTVGGVWTFTRELTAGLLEAGYAVALVSFGRTPSAEQSRWVMQMGTRWGSREFRFEASEAPLEWMEGNERTWAEGAATVRRVTEDFRPDLVHASQFCWGALDPGVPVVITAHSDVLSWAAACRPEGLANSNWLRTYVRLVTEGLAGAAKVVAPTEWMSRALERNFPVPNGVDMVANGRRLSPSPMPARERAMRAISVGRLWDDAKGMGLLAEGNWPMPIVVAGEDRFGGEARAGIAGVTALGLLSEEELQAEMQASAVYLCLSVYEPFGLAAVEAGMCGCAVICRDIPSLREVWEEEALYFKDASELRSVLRKLKEKAGLLAAMQARARLWAQWYSREAMEAGYLRVYREAVAADPTHRGEAAMNGPRVPAEVVRG